MLQIQEFGAATEAATGSDSKGMHAYGAQSVTEPSVDVLSSFGRSPSGWAPVAM